jgi:hypothetical protein
MQNGGQISPPYSLKGRGIMQDESELESVWYSRGLAFECTQCGNCCSGPAEGYVWVTQDEIHSLANHVGLADRLDEFERRFTRSVGTRTSLVEYSDGDCIFLDPMSRTCSVYESRPNQCRTWPFWRNNLETPKSWAQASKSCPGCNRGRLYSLSEIRSTLRSDERT